jgi:P27 family predicted phage terminase small subunit
MSRKKTIEELKASGGWDHMGEHSRVRRMREEELARYRATVAVRSPEQLSYIRQGRPRCPKDLSPAAKAVFKNLCYLLEDRGTLTDADGELLRLYAITFDRHARAIAHLQTEGEFIQEETVDKQGNTKILSRLNGWLAVAERSERQMIAIGIQLGLTPAARDKVKATRRYIRAGSASALLPPLLERKEKA